MNHRKQRATHDQPAPTSCDKLQTKYITAASCDDSSRIMIMSTAYHIYLLYIQSVEEEIERVEIMCKFINVSNKISTHSSVSSAAIQSTSSSGLNMCVGHQQRQHPHSMLVIPQCDLHVRYGSIRSLPSLHFRLYPASASVLLQASMRIVCWYTRAMMLRGRRPSRLVHQLVDVAVRFGVHHVLIELRIQFGAHRFGRFGWLCRKRT